LSLRGRISAEDLFRLWKPNCEYCGIGITAMACTFDHVIAFDRGGENTASNIVPCCVTCQRSKFVKTPTEYQAWMKLSNVCPIDGTVFRPRWADHIRGLGKYCSRRCAGSVGGQA
jgi:hypothetical protein